MPDRHVTDRDAPASPMGTPQTFAGLPYDRQNATVSPYMCGERPWRVGRKVGRTIYDNADVLIGVMDTPALARAVVEAVNATQTSRQENTR